MQVTPSGHNPGAAEGGNRRLAAYEAAYGTGSIRLMDEDLRTAGLSRTPD